MNIFKFSINRIVPGVALVLGLGWAATAQEATDKLPKDPSLATSVILSSAVSN